MSAGYRTPETWHGYSDHSASADSGFHFKGEGKRGSLGVAIQPTRTATQTEGKANTPPSPIQKTKEEAQALFDEGYFSFPARPFWDGKSFWDVDRGSHCLWKGIKVGKNCGVSTKAEVFHGECHGWAKEEGFDMVILS